MPKFCCFLEFPKFINDKLKFLASGFCEISERMYFDPLVFSSFGGFSAAPTASSMYAPKSEISYDTSSRDPVAMR